MTSDREKTPILFAPDALEGMDISWVREGLQYLTREFGGKYSSIFPTAFHTRNQLLETLHLSNIIKGLRFAPTYSKLLEQFPHDVNHSTTMAFLAESIRSKVANLEFEPRTARGECLADLSVDYLGTRILLECKAPDPDVFIGPLTEQRIVFDQLLSGLTSGGEIFIAYRGALMERNIPELIGMLNRKLPKVTGPGVLYYDAMCAIEVTSKEVALIPDERMELSLPPFESQFRENNQINIIKDGNLGVAFCRQDIPMKGSFETQIKHSRYKTDGSLPYVLVMNAAKIPGNRIELRNSFSANFFKGKNKSFTAAVLFNWSVTEKDITFDPLYISNPFARIPAPQLEQLFLRATMGRAAQ